MCEFKVKKFGQSWDKTFGLDRQANPSPLSCMKTYSHKMSGSVKMIFRIIQKY